MSALKKAITDHGLFGECIINLTLRDIKNINKPAILHVKSTMKSPEYNHYVILLGINGNNANIFSPSQELETIPINELLFRWDRSALLVSDKPIQIGKIKFDKIKRFYWLIISVFLFIFLFHWLRLKHFYNLSISTKFYCSIIQFTGFLLIAFFLGFIAHFFPNEGFFSHIEAVNSVRENHAGNFIPKINLSKLLKMPKNTSLIDARTEHDFNSNHIEGAINIPVNCSDEYYKKAVLSLPKDNYIVLYCHSANCKYAEKIALRLKKDGFKKLSIFKEGWVEWEKENKSY